MNAEKYLTVLDAVDDKLSNSTAYTSVVSQAFQHAREAFKQVQKYGTTEARRKLILRALSRLVTLAGEAHGASKLSRHQSRLRFLQTQVREA